MSSPTNEVLPLFEIQQKTVRGKHPRDPRMLQGCVIPPLSAPRPPGRPPSRPAAAAAAAATAARRMLTEAWVWSPPRPAADSRQGPDPGSPPCSPPAAPPQPPTIPARLCLQAASRGPTLKCFPAADRQPYPDAQGSRPRGPAPSAGGAGGRAGPDLLTVLFPAQPLSPSRSPPRTSQCQKVVT